MPNMEATHETDNPSCLWTHVSCPGRAGIKDAFSAAGFPCFGPSASSARLEASKAFSKDFMARHNIPTARYRNFTSYDEAVAHVQAIDYPVVLKASGLAAGKGVLMPENKEETLQGLKEIMVDRAFGSAGDEVVIEELLIGEEVSWSRTM
jgi:phosphoribosylamine--glycine ligase / phosphoribosylformylglycinamidine cyclo-ligase